MKSNFLTLLVFIIAGTLKSQEIRMNLASILDSVKLGNPAMKIYSDEIKSMDEAAKGANSWMPPEVSSGLWMTPYNPMMWKKSDAGTPGMGQYMFGVRQMIPNPKKIQADANYMGQMSSIEKMKQSATLNELLNNAKLFYFDWLILSKKLQILRQDEELLRFMIETAELRYKNGLDKLSAYYKAKAALGNVQNMQLMYENEIRMNRINLNTLMGKNPENDFNIDTIYFLGDFSNMVFDSAFFNQNRSDLKALDEEIKLNGLKIETEKMSLKPQFGVQFDHMVGFGGIPQQFTAMAMMKIPMASWASRMTKANIESLRWKTSAIESEKKMLFNEYTGMAYALRSEFELKKRQIKIYDTAIIPALINNYKTMQLGYQQNTEELFMLFDAWETLYMTQLENTELLKDALVLQVNLERISEFGKQ